MTTPRLTLLWISYRPGGIDLLARSLAAAGAAPYELVVVDDCPGRVQRGAARRHLLERGVPLTFYGGSKPHPYAPIKCGMTNALNTGLLHARAPHVVILHDYCLFPPGFVDDWVAAFATADDRALISGSAIVYAAPEPAAPGDVQTYPGDVLLNIAAKWPWVPVAVDGSPAFENFHAGFPLAFLEECNGFDERADHCICWSVSSVVAQARLLGYELKTTQHLVAHMLDHREWSGGAETRRTGKDSLWRISGWSDTPDPAHDEPAWQARSPNLWDFKESRRRTLGL